MLFIFETSNPKKYLLHVSNANMTNHVIDLEGLQEVLSRKIDLPKGKLYQICAIEGVIILMWDFENFISCRKAGRRDFVHVVTDERLYPFEWPWPKASFSLPFFILNEKHGVVFHDEEKQIMKESYTFPLVSKSERKSAFYRSPQAHNFNVDRVDATKTTHHFCQFSGGGDIYITKDLSSLVFVTPINNNSSPTVSGPEDSMEFPNLSPTSSSDSKLISLSIEAKKQLPDVEELQYQLWANMILLAVEKFKESVSFNTKENLLQLDRLIGYGMACSGDGVVGAFKLEIDLIGNYTRFVTKVKLGARERIQAASLMDYILKYFDKID